MASSLEILDVTSSPRYDDLVSKYKYIIHPPLASTTYSSNDEIHFRVENQNDFWHPSESFVMVEGNLALKPADGRTAAKACIFVENAILHLFSECRYLLNGVEVDKTRNLGISSTLKGMCSLTPHEVSGLANAGWGEFSNNMKTVTGGHFAVCIPVKLILGYFEDYRKILLSARQELIFVRAGTDRNAVVSTFGDTEASEVAITKMSWVIPSVGVNDRARVSLLNVINKDKPIVMPFRSWAYHENPAVPQTTEFTWNITSASPLERPRYVLIGFQTNRKNRYAANSNQFDHVNIVNLKLFLNTELYPYNNLNLDFTKEKYGQAYQILADFQKSYYKRGIAAPYVNYKQFAQSTPIFVVDCSNQDEGVKFSGCDIRLEVQCSQAIAANTTCHCLILHDKVVDYTPLSNIVRKF
jgi:hypothetical protein